MKIQHYYNYCSQKNIRLKPMRSAEVMYGSNKFWDNQNGRRNKYWGMNASKETK